MPWQWGFDVHVCMCVKGPRRAVPRFLLNPLWLNERAEDSNEDVQDRQESHENEKVDETAIVTRHFADWVSIHSSRSNAPFGHCSICPQHKYAPVTGKHHETSHSNSEEGVLCVLVQVQRYPDGEEENKEVNRKLGPACISVDGRRPDPDIGHQERVHHLLDILQPLDSQVSCSRRNAH